MRNIFKTYLRPVLRKFGFDLIPCQTPDSYFLPSDFEEMNKRIFHAVKEFTMTSPERINALIEAVQYVHKNRIEGAFVECGVWRGGSVMAMALTLRELSTKNRKIYLYDTFAGMSRPSGDDISLHGDHAHRTFTQRKTAEDASDWCYAPLDEVKKNIISNTTYPKENLHFIKGKVEHTIPDQIPKKIALLRLDTDWYESTRHELIHLFPRLTPGGVLIIDDYGHWQGARKAIDEYIIENNLCILLNRIDYTGRIAVKLP
jgi:hypothetical protein